jgi:hypothetical protein
MAGLAVRAVFGILLAGAAGTASTIPISGLTLWLDAIPGVTPSGGNASARQDQSGNANIAMRTKASNRPLVAAITMNGLPATQLTAGERFVDSEAISATPSGARGMWFLATMAAATTREKQQGR